MSSELIVAIYLLVGFQIGGRMFYWVIKIRKEPVAFIVCLILVPILWPAVLLISLFPCAIHDAVWRWDK